MGRRGVDKRKRTKEKSAPVSGKSKVENQPALVVEKEKASAKESKKR